MKFNRNTFKYGFEIEGMFSNQLIRTMPGSFKFDGSVRFMSSEIDSFRSRCNTSMNTSGSYSEYTSKILSYDKMIKELEKFDDSNYAFNNTTGLHVHISMGNDTEKNRKMMALFCNYVLIAKLQKYALTFCECQKDRLVSRHKYCEPYRTRRVLLSSYKSSSKYKFVRFHSYYNTLEFRFLKPCEHKVENVKKLVDYVVKYYSQQLLIKNRQSIDESPEKVETMNINLKGNKVNEVLYI